MTGTGMGMLFGVIISFIATIVIFIMVMPERNYQSLGGFGKFLSDLFNFRSLLIEGILKFTYAFLTILVIVEGFIFLFEEFFAGLAVMVLAPLAIRLVYEFMMMTVLLVQNVISINSKLLEKKSETPKMPVAPGAMPMDRPAPAARPVMDPSPAMARTAAPVNPAPAARLVQPQQTSRPVQPQAQPTGKAFCNQCGKEVGIDMTFCNNCGCKLK